MFERNLITAFHQTSERFYPGINNIKPGYFFDIIDLCREWGFDFWNRDLADGEKTGCQTITITFDDGYADNFEILIRLCEQRITPLLFVPTGYIGRKNSWEYSSSLFPAHHLDESQLRQLTDKGVIIGSHGVSHRSFTSMSRDRVVQELTDSRKRLEDITGTEIEYLSFPFGRSSRVINKQTQNCGYRFAFGLDGDRREGINDDFVIPRTAIYGLDDYFSLHGKIVSGSKMERFKNRTINDLAAGTIIFSGRLN
ncbi:MAG: polysaccharide deacetylase family protein [FCB group bacterium]|nr:polysaccharide deacetylase family protein [FCB group bacterium]